MACHRRRGLRHLLNLLCENEPKNELIETLEKGVFQGLVLNDHPNSLIFARNSQVFVVDGA